MQSLLPCDDANFVTQMLRVAEMLKRLMKDVYFSINFKHRLKQMFLDVKSRAPLNLEVVPTTG